MSAVEYGLLIAAVALALVGMMKFLSNAVSQRAKSGADSFGGGLLY